MRSLKIIIGMACLMMALFFGLVISSGFYNPAKLPLIAYDGWLAGSGVLLIMRRNLPLLRRGGVLFLLNFGLLIGCFVFAVAHNLVAAQGACCANACVNNLRQIDAAANEFALENHLTNGSRINFPDDLTPYIKLNSAGKIPSCPDGGIYHIDKVGEPPTCSLGNTITPGHVLE